MIRLRQIEPGLWRAAGLADARSCQEWPVGATVAFEPQKARSSAQERRWFGRIKRAWDNLDDDLRARFPDPEALRKWALIRAGWCENKDSVLETEEAALAYAAGLKWGEPYSIVVVKGRVVFAYRARSQGRKAMSKQQFAEYTERGLAHLAELIGYDPATIPWEEAA